MFINEYASDMILKCKILSDCPDNVSDHMALCASLSISVCQMILELLTNSVSVKRFLKPIGMM